jgi:hypothetical protein
VVEEIRKIVEADKNQNYNFLIDLTTSGTIHAISAKARKAYESLGQYSNINRSAVVGKSLFLEVTVNLIVQALGKGNSFKWFDNVEDAKQWLIEG